MKTKSLIILPLLIMQISLAACKHEVGDEPSKASNAHVAESLRTANSNISDSRRNAITQAIEAVSPAVVGINVTEIREYRTRDPFWMFFYGDRTYQRELENAGSGFIISSNGYIVTNDHVAGRANRIVVTMANGDQLPAKLIGSDPVTDIALIKIEDVSNLPYLKFGNSDDVIVGEWSIAFGNPFGLFSASKKPTVTVGVISATHVYLEQREGRVYRNMLQTDASINSGNSGGPLVNSLGEVIGVNTVIYSPNQGSVGLGFAVPINRVKEITDILKTDGKVERDFSPGFRVQLVNDAIARAYNLDKAEGVIVTDVSSRGMAAKAGLEVADIIVKANEEPIYSIDALEGMIRYAKKGDRIRLEVIRSNKRITLTMEM